MTGEGIKNQLITNWSHILFDYQGKKCGIDPFNLAEFDMWFGDEAMTAHSVDELMHTPFFNGKSLIDIAPFIKNIEG